MIEIDFFLVFGVPLDAKPTQVFLRYAFRFIVKRNQETRTR